MGTRYPLQFVYIIAGSLLSAIRVFFRFAYSMHRFRLFCNTVAHAILLQDRLPDFLQQRFRHGLQIPAQTQADGVGVQLRDLLKCREAGAFHRQSQPQKRHVHGALHGKVMHKGKLLFGLCPGKRAALHRAFGHAAHTSELLGGVLGRLFNQEYARVAIGQTLQNGFAVFLCDLPRCGGLFAQ